MIIDSHQHFWDVGRFSYSWMDPESALNRSILPESLKPQLVETGVDRTILVEAHGSLEETDWFLQLSEENDFIAGVVAWVDLLAPGLDERLDRYGEHPGFKGVRHKVHDEPDTDWLAREDVAQALSELAARGIPYDLLLRPQHLRHVALIAEQNPDLMMVVDHIAKPLITEGLIDDWAKDIRAIASIPSVSCKLSGMVTEADWEAWTSTDLKPYVDTVVDAFGFSRLMFGSDWPVCELAADYGGVQEALRECVGKISDAEEADLFGGTAARFYRLDG
jgi:L-fuconolactonase